ncbi:MAG: DUF4038 domain-containing protein [Victivallales bacterium]|nr:DUF4038 domain-containing protein [Victivallales bacterium]
MKKVKQNCVAELDFIPFENHKDTFSEAEFSATFTAPDGSCKTVPGFRTNTGKWKIRYSSAVRGMHSYRTTCSENGDSGLEGKTGEIMVEAYRGKNSLLLHGPVEVAADGHHFQHSDGTPFFWLGDTWWMGLCKRMTWPKGFQMLAKDRVKKGFTVIQIVAGLYPDMPAFDERGANEAGFPWDKDYKRINPEYFDIADRRIQYLVESGLAPCIVGCWGYFLPWMGIEKMEKHWRNLARLPQFGQ